MSSKANRIIRASKASVHRIKRRPTAKAYYSREDWMSWPPVGYPSGENEGQANERW